MGTRNRKRRAEKLRRRQRASTPRSDRRADGAPVRDVIYAAVEALRRSDATRYGELLGVLAGGPPGLAADFDSVTREVLAVVWKRNWDAVEVRRQTERRLGAAHARCVGDMIGRASGDGIGRSFRGPATVDALALAVEVLALLLSLPPLPRLGDAPRPAGRPARSAGDPRILGKVRALLAKAESTTFAEEAEALSAKAQELMSKHAIDAAMVGGPGGGGVGAPDAPTGVRLPVDDPYAGAKSILLSEVASANRCRAVWSKGLGISTVLGFESDLEFVELLYTSLLVQATSAMVAAGSQLDRQGRSRTRSFRQSFLLAYATRIGHRLRAAEAASRTAATEEYGEALLPVLADRSAAVAAAQDAAFPGAIGRSVSVTNAAGWAAGSAAADLASLAGRTEVPTGSV